MIIHVSHNDLDGYGCSVVFDYFVKTICKVKDDYYSLGEDHGYRYFIDFTHALDKFISNNEEVPIVFRDVMSEDSGLYSHYCIHCSYDDVDDKIIHEIEKAADQRFLSSQIGVKPRFFVSDLRFSEETLDYMCEAKIIDRDSKDKYVCIFDHHKTFEKKIPIFADKGVHCYYSKDMCSTFALYISIMYSLSLLKLEWHSEGEYENYKQYLAGLGFFLKLEEEMMKLKEFALAVDNYDMWRDEKDDGDQLNNLFQATHSSSGNKYFVDRFLGNPSTELLPNEKFLLDNYTMSKDQYVKDAIDSTMINSNGKHTYGIILAEKHASIIGNRALREEGVPKVDYVKIINVKENKVSLRSLGDFDVSVIAEANGGGGHKNAAGYYSKNIKDEF